jgi:hypothetical protein
MKTAVNWLSKRWFNLSCLLIIVVLLGSIGIQVTDRPASPSSLTTIGIGDKVIRIGSEAEAAGSVDYTFGAANANVQFATAIAALPTQGGRLVVVSATNINFAALTTVNVSSNITIEGSGRGTYFVGDGVTSPFTATGNNVVFSNISVNVNAATFLAAMGATTGWMWTNVATSDVYFAYRSPTGQARFNDVTVASLADSGLTSGRVPIAGAGGLIGDDADLTFTGGNTLTATQFGATTLTGTISGNAQTVNSIGHIGIATNSVTSSAIITNEDYIGSAESKYSLNTYLKARGAFGANSVSGVVAFVDISDIGYVGSGLYSGGSFTTRLDAPGGVTGTLTAPSVSGIVSSAYTYSNISTSGTVASLWASNWGNARLGGTLTNAVGVLINSPTVTGTTNNTFGVYVNNIAGGSDTNYSIYTGTGDISLGDDINFRQSANVTASGNITLTPSSGNYVTLSSTKATAGDPAGVEGMIYINTSDNATKVYAGGAWRTIAAW